MIQSMTAFANVQLQSDSLVLSWEMRSLNHRYLDITFRLPESFRHLEAHLRQVLRGKISRGKLDFQLKMNEPMAKTVTLEVNEPLVQALQLTAKHLAVTHELPDDLTFSQMMLWPGVMVQKSAVVDGFSDDAERLFQEGVAQLLDGKRSEGSVLATQIHDRLIQLRHEIRMVREHTSMPLLSAREKLMRRLDELQMKVADTRLEQELALMLIRFDVSEELDRLDAHVDGVAQTLDSETCSGKRLDFLMQELNREANTLGSKADSVQLSQSAVQMKVLIEQMREQIQNIE